MQVEGWSHSKLADVASKKIVYGIVQAGEHDEAGMPYIKSSDVGSAIQPEGLAKTALTIHQKYHRSTVHPGDIVFSLRGNTGATSIVPSDLPEANLTQGTARVSVAEEFDNRFVRYVLASDIAMRQVLAVAKGSTFTEVSLDALRKITLPHPPLPEQRKIADILSTWDAAIEKTEALLATARTQKRALMQQLLTGKRRFSEFEGQPWQEVRLGEVCDPKQWTTIAGKNMTETGFPVYGANGHIGFFSEYNHEDETIAVGCRGVCGSVHLTPPKSYITGNSMALDQVDPSKAVVRFLFQYLTYFGFRDIVSGSAQPQITGRAIKAYRLSLPPVEEQKRVADLLQAADDEVKWIKTEITKLRTEKKALMQQLLTGKRRVVV